MKYVLSRVAELRRELQWSCYPGYPVDLLFALVLLYALLVSVLCIQVAV